VIALEYAQLIAQIGFELLPVGGVNYSARLCLNPYRSLTKSSVFADLQEINGTGYIARTIGDWTTILLERRVEAAVPHADWENLDPTPWEPAYYLAVTLGTGGTDYLAWFFDLTQGTGNPIVLQQNDKITIPLYRFDLVNFGDY
jgi:hypothetical protein